ncbi:interleukin-1 beta-like [Emydura macquarii macquarii]|uniref:interleukin-1 beta-like n=1 Tax=Emydura macquarii macquarii TaxID=1129001 RepID=UPI003529DCE9
MTGIDGTFDSEPAIKLWSATCSLNIKPPASVKLHQGPLARHLSLAFGLVLDAVFGAAMARVPDMLTELMGCDSGHQEVDCPCRMESSFYDSRPRPFPKSCSTSELSSHWKDIDHVDSVASRQAVELPQGETRWRRKRSFPDFHPMRMLDGALVEDPVPNTTAAFAYAESFTYKYTRSKLHTVRDEEHKSLVLQRHPGQAHLVAMHLRGSNSSKEVKLNLDLYRSPHSSPKHLSPMALNIVESNTVENNLYLSCVRAGGSPLLQLEKVKGPMKVIRSGDLDRFLFFKTTSGSTSSLESVAHPGWFVSTSKLNNKPIRMVNQTGEQDITDFYLVEV